VFKVANAAMRVFTAQDRQNIWKGSTSCQLGSITTTAPNILAYLKQIQTLKGDDCNKDFLVTVILQFLPVL
jgi:hypothetical protein